MKAKWAAVRFIENASQGVLMSAEVFGSMMLPVNAFGLQNARGYRARV